MKQKYIFIGIILMLALVLYGTFSVYQSNLILKEKELIKEEEMSFQNKQKCASYLNDIKKDLIKRNGTDKNLGINFYWSVEEVWFSKNKNSCLYTTKTEIVLNKDGTTGIVYVINDYLTNLEIENFSDYSKYLEKRKELN